VKLVRSTSSFAVPAVLALVAAACSAAGTPGTEGKAGADGAPGTPAEAPPRDAAINLVEPRVGLVARRLEVTIATDGNVDLAKAKVDFGDGIKVLGVQQQGAALVARIEIGANAKLGKRDVVVEAGGQTLTAKHGFVVAVHLDAKIGAGKAEQGGLVRLDISNRDTIQFDTKNFTLFPLVGQKDASLIGLAYQSFTATDGSVVFLGDPRAKTGALGFLGFNDPNDEQSPSFLTAQDAITVSARTPTALTANTSTNAAFEKELETGFYSIDLAPAAKEGLLVDAWAQVPDDSTMAPLLLAYPESGSAADLLAQGSYEQGIPLLGIPGSEARVAYPVTEASKGYFVLLDGELAHGPTTKTVLDYTAVRAQIVAEKPADHATGATAQNIGSLPLATNAIPARLITGELKTAEEVDVYSFDGFSASNATDILVSVVSDSDVLVHVDFVPTFDSDQLVEISRGGKAGMGVTADVVGQKRFIKVVSVPDSGKPTGKYTLGIKRIAPVVVQP